MSLNKSTIDSGQRQSFFNITSARREALWGYFFIAPWLIGLFLFTLGPIIAVFVFSFTKYPILSNPEWIGFENYYELMDDPLFLKSLGNTAFFVIFRVPVFLMIAFMLALLLNRKGLLISGYRALIYIPAMAPIVALAIIWSVLLNPRSGYLNYYGGLVGIPQLNWLTDPDLIKPVIVVLSLWSVGTATIIFLAGLQSIPSHLYEAAIIDGANGWQQLFYVTIPMMTPVILFNLIVEVINSFQVFAYAFILSGGGPLNASLFYVLYIFRNAFEFFKMGYASALAVVLFIIIFIFTLILVKTSDRWVIYERI